MRGILHDLHKLEHLSSLWISFHSSTRTRSSNDRERIFAFRKDFLTGVLTLLINSPSTKTRIENLYISPFQCRNDPNLTSSVGFVNFLRIIRFLKLATQSECTWDAPRDKVALPVRSVDFYTTLPDTWLLPACQSLNLLYLSADFDWGWYPRVDFRHIHFLHLQSLTLRVWAFSHDWQLEWLLGHSRSLRRLRLIECSILAFANATPHFLDCDGYLVRADDNSNAGVLKYRLFKGRWCHYFKSFASALPHLQMFSLQKY